MCGIVGYIGKRDATPVLVEGLHRLEYRGYDSAGLAVVHRGRLQLTKTAGRVQDLRDKLDAKQTKATVGIGHTRWATHGEPNDTNAHPHTDANHRVAVVHNGIIENAEALRAQLTADGVTFVTDTDTECLAHMVARELEASDDTSLEDAVIATLRKVEGTYGLVFLDRDDPSHLVVARNGSPIVLGLGESEMFVASDVAALVRYTRQVIYLEDGEVATIKATDYHTTTLSGGSAGNSVKTPTTVDADADDYELGAFSDYMRKEIHEQPDAIRRAVMGRLDERFATAKLGGVNLDARELRNIKHVKFLGCGSAYYAGQMGAALVEELARIPADAEPASEFRYRSPVVDPDTLYVAVSQSGETSDTLMAVQELKRKGGQVWARSTSSAARSGASAATASSCTRAPKSRSPPPRRSPTWRSTSRCSRLLLGRVRDLCAASGGRIVNGLRNLPSQVAGILNAEEEIAAIAHRYAEAEHMFFIGRVRGWPVAREGAQKLKEISYVHAEAYQAGELKHGPLALIQPEMPSVVIIPADDLVAKNISTIEQIKARGGPVIALASVRHPDSIADW